MSVFGKRERPGQELERLRERWLRNLAETMSANGQGTRPEQVDRLAKLINDEYDAILFDGEGSREYPRAKGLLDAALRHSTFAEYQAALAQTKQQPLADHDHGADSTGQSGSICDAQPEFSHQPSSESTHVTGGSAMSSIEEIRAILADSNAKAEATQAALAHAGQQMREIQASLAQAAQGSSQTAIQEAMGLYVQITDTTDQLLGMVTAARTAVESYIAGL